MTARPLPGQPGLLDLRVLPVMTGLLLPVLQGLPDPQGPQGRVPRVQQDLLAQQGRQGPQGRPLCRPRLLTAARTLFPRVRCIMR